MVEKMRLYAVFGHPVAHSLSPIMHNQAFMQRNWGCHYFPVEVAPPDLARKLEAFRNLGGEGLNLTRPLKETVLPLLRSQSRWVDLTQAANTLVWHQGGWVGDNTDAKSLVQHLTAYNLRPAAGSALILGAGGAARASAASLSHLGYEVTVASRKPESAGWAPHHLPWEEIFEVPECPWDVIVNATPLGQIGEPPWERMPYLPRAHSVVVDWVYRPRWTPLLQYAQTQQCPVIDGLSLLVAQARLAWQLWFDQLGPQDAMWESVAPWQ